MNQFIKVVLDDPQETQILIDIDDVSILAEHRCIRHDTPNTTYARCTDRVTGKRKMLHTLLMKPPKGMMADHINHDGLDNRRGNLRVVTSQQNGWNAKKHRATASKYKGVSRSRSTGDYPWNAHIACPETRKRIYLGRYPTEEAAARGYDQAATRLFGEYACLNFPKGRAGRKKGSLNRPATPVPSPH